ncbi:MAG: DUF2085 domain-containing protein [Bacteroidota bacterium]
MTLSRKISLLAPAFAGLWCLSFVAAPVLRSMDIPLSSMLYSLFSEVCHQIPDRSFQIGGEPLAVCIRCSAIYFSIFASLLFSLFLTRFHFNKYPPAWILTAAVAPIVLDVLLNLSGIHASTVWTRTLSGVVAGLVVPFFLMPPLIEAIHQLKEKFGELSHAGKTQ